MDFKMVKLLSLSLIGLLLAVVSGCHSGKQVVPLPEPPNRIGKDSATMVFIFAETDFLTIDSDMMADQFRAGINPNVGLDIDSQTAYQGVYEMLLDSLLASEADQFDLSTVPYLQRQYLNLRRDKVFRLMYEGEITKRATVADSALQIYYDSNIERFKLPNLYRARHIVVEGGALSRTEDSLDYKGMSKEALDSVALLTISNIRQRILDGAVFEEMAMMYSQDPQTAPKGGDLGYFELSQMVQPFDSTVEHTPIGEISEIIKTRYGWHIVVVEDYKAEHYQPLDSISYLIRAELLRGEQARMGKEFVDSIKVGGQVDIDSLEVMKPDSLKDPDDLLAVVNAHDRLTGNDVITYFDYREQLNPYKKAHGITDSMSYENAVELITQLANKFHLMRASKILGYYNAEEVEAWSEAVIAKYAVSTRRKKMFDLGEYPTEADQREYYEANLGNYAVERPLHVQHIIFSDSGFAEHIRNQLNGGLDFWDAVDEYYPGDPDIKRAAADLGYIGPDDMPASFYRVALGTAVGQISRPVKTEYGFHLIKMIERVNTRSFERSDSKIRAILVKERKHRIRDKFVISKLGKPPVIHWDRRAELYKKVVPPPTGTFGGM